MKKGKMEIALVACVSSADGTDQVRGVPTVEKQGTTGRESERDCSSAAPHMTVFYDEAALSAAGIGARMKLVRPLGSRLISRRCGEKDTGAALTQ
jgi:hypothetical protein